MPRRTENDPLGLAFEGHGVSQDDVEAVHWFRLAANQGNADQFRLGYMYHSGRGVPQDYAEGARWFHEAVDQKEPMAQYALGIIYDAGMEVPQNPVEAYMWFGLSASRTAGEERKKRAASQESLAKRMTAQQINEAQRRIREWTPNTGQDNTDS